MADLGPSDLQAQARALGDPTRHRLFRYVAEAAGPVGVAELTTYLGIHHNAVRQHLAKLRDAGLVVEDLEPRTVPGRRRLVYRPAPDLDERWLGGGPYERLAGMLLEVARSGRPARAVGREVGRAEAAARPKGADEGAVEALVASARRQGFRPLLRRRGDRVELVLQGCPIADVAERDAALVCDLHLGLLEGWADATAGAPDAVQVERLLPRPPHRAGCRALLGPRVADGDGRLG